MGFFHANLESFPGIVDIAQVHLILISQFERASTNITIVVIHDELKFLLDRINFAL